MVAKKVFNELISWGKAILFAVVLSIFISAFLFQPYTVSGSSMEPTFQGKDSYDTSKVGDRVMLFKTSYILGEEAKHEDIVVIDSRVQRPRTLIDNLFESPLVRMMIDRNHPAQIYWIKRIIGVPGDTLEYKNGKVHRNGVELKEDYIKEEMHAPFKKVVVPENHVFVMGDNRNYSKDSREIGVVPIDNVLGKVILRYYPLHKFGR
jgi:signal peptidase I